MPAATRPINILQLSSTLTVGGAEQLLLGLAKGLDRQRFAVHICSLASSRGNVLQPEFEALGLPVKMLDARRTYDPHIFAAVARYVREHDIDIIQTHLTNADIMGRAVGRLLGIPVLSTMQNEPQAYHRRGRFNHWVERLTARWLNPVLIVVAQRLRTMYVQEWGIPAGRVTVIPNAVTMEPYLTIAADSRAHTEDDEIVITNIGRLNPQKAQRHLLDAAKIVLERYPRAHFMIVGTGRLEQELKDQAAQLGIADHVTFTGVRRDIDVVLAQSDIFVLPSLWEGLPLTAIEAMASARPVILSDVGGNRELVEDGVQGLIVPPADVGALAQALIALAGDPERRVAMGEAGRARVQHEYNIATIVAQYGALYESLVSKPQLSVSPVLSTRQE